MIYFLYGDNDFLIDQRVTELKKQFAAKYNAGDIHVVDIDSVLPEDLMAQLTAMSLFTTHQMIVAVGVTNNSEAWSLLETNINYIPEDTVAVLTNVKTTSKVNNLTITKTFKKLKTSGAKLEKFDLPKSRDIKNWLASEVKRRQLQMDAAAQAQLLQLTAGDDNQQARLAIELSKLLLIGGTITAEIVKKYVEPSLETNAFAIFGAAIAGDTEKAVALLRQLQQSGEDSNRFLGLLASQELALAAAITDANIKISPYQLSQARNLASELGNKDEQMAKLRRAATVLAELDGQVKLSNPDDAWRYIEIALNKLA